MIAQQGMLYAILLGFFLLKEKKDGLPMTNLEILEKLTLGKQATEEVEIQGETYTIRPLTSGELAKLQSIEKKGFTMKVGVTPQGQRKTVTTNTDVDINAGEFNEQQAEAMYHAIAWSLSVEDEEIDPNLIRQLPVGIPEDLFEKIVEISNLSDKDLTIIKTFRKE